MDANIHLGINKHAQKQAGDSIIHTLTRSKTEEKQKKKHDNLKMSCRTGHFLQIPKDTDHLTHTVQQAFYWRFHSFITSVEIHLCFKVVCQKFTLK